MQEKTFTVTEINNYINKKLKMDPKLKNIYVKGEISNYKSYPRGHDYFTLKDEKTQISAVMYKLNKKRFLKFKPENGMKVIIKGKIEVYPPNGNYQLYATTMTEDGVGDLHIAYEQLRKKLEKEGLFDKSHKKEIPKYPKRIGVVTAKTGAAIKDIITTIKRRYPICEIYIFSTLVQGQDAPNQITSQIKRAQNYNLDTLIVGRGGGSFEDLNAFNDENVVHEIYNSKIPVISAVGHETDFTLVDFVSDIRAPTPTAAAEFAVPKLSEIQYKVDQLAYTVNNNIKNRLNQHKSKLNHIVEKQIFKNPESIYQIKQMHLDNLISKLDYSSKSIISKNKTKLLELEHSVIFKNPQTLYESKHIRLDQLTNKLNYVSRQLLSDNKNRLERVENSPIFKNPQSMYQTKEIKLDNIVNKLNYTSKEIISKNKNKLSQLENSPVLRNPKMIIKSKEEQYSKNIAKLEILNPLLTLKRGYTVTRVNDKVISSSKDVKSGDELDIEFKDGKINTKVIWWKI